MLMRQRQQQRSAAPHDELRRADVRRAFEMAVRPSRTAVRCAMR